MNLKKKENCSIFLTAGYPALNSALTVVPDLAKAGVDLIELGIPFSDPLADGPVIQESSAIALKNGMTIDILFEQVKQIKRSTSIPIVLMGYFNPIFKYGLEKFLKKCVEMEIEGLIIPDLTIDIYEKEYRVLFERFAIPLVFLITPVTPLERIRKIEAHSKTFIYLVSFTSITGNTGSMSNEQEKGFERIAELNLSVPVLVGFGIHNKATFNRVCAFFEGGIIGSAFIRSQTAKIPVGTFINEIIN